MKPENDSTGIGHPCGYTIATVRPFHRNFLIVEASREKVNPSTGVAVPGSLENLNVNNLGRKVRNRLVRHFNRAVYDKKDCPQKDCHCQLNDGDVRVEKGVQITGTTSFNLTLKRNEYIHPLNNIDQKNSRTEAQTVLRKIQSGNFAPSLHSNETLSIDSNLDIVTIENINRSANIVVTYFVSNCFRYHIKYSATATLTYFKGSCQSSNL